MTKIADSLRDPRRELPVDARPVHAAISALAVKDLTSEELDELDRSMAAGLKAIREQDRRNLGWRRSSVTTPCPRWVAKQKCLGYDCPCHTLTDSLDHWSAWTHKGKRILLGEPYSICPQEIAFLHQWCQELDVYLAIYGDSAYFPGRTLTIHVESYMRPK